MPKPIFLVSLLFISLVALDGQVTFPDLVDRAFGGDQELINGIQFSNHYSQIEGHPYLFDEGFQSGSLCINNRRVEKVMLRYNLYSQKIEILYWTVKGYLNRFMSVPEQIQSFSLEGFEFRRMEFPGELPAYYQVVSSGRSVCYIGWKKDIGSSRSSSSRKHSFNTPRTQYWLGLEQDFTPFHNRKTFMNSFPLHLRKEISKQMKKQKFSFKKASPHETEEMISAALYWYETGKLP